MNSLQEFKLHHEYLESEEPILELWKLNQRRLRDIKARTIKFVSVLFASKKVRKQIDVSKKRV